MVKATNLKYASAYSSGNDALTVSEDYLNYQKTLNPEFKVSLEPFLEPEVRDHFFSFLSNMAADLGTNTILSGRGSFTSDVADFFGDIGPFKWLLDKVGRWEGGQGRSTDATNADYYRTLSIEELAKLGVKAKKPMNLLQAGHKQVMDEREERFQELMSVVDYGAMGEYVAPFLMGAVGVIADPLSMGSLLLTGALVNATLAGAKATGLTSIMGRTGKLIEASIKAETAASSAFKEALLGGVLTVEELPLFAAHGELRDRPYTTEEKLLHGLMNVGGGAAFGAVAGARARYKRVKRDLKIKSIETEIKEENAKLMQAMAETDLAHGRAPNFSKYREYIQSRKVESAPGEPAYAFTEKNIDDVKKGEWFLSFTGGSEREHLNVLTEGRYGKVITATDHSVLARGEAADPISMSSGAVGKVEVANLKIIDADAPISPKLKMKIVKELKKVDVDLEFENPKTSTLKEVLDEVERIAQAEEHTGAQETANAAIRESGYDAFKFVSSLPEKHNSLVILEPRRMDLLELSEVPYVPKTELSSKAKQATKALTGDILDKNKNMARSPVHEDIDNVPIKNFTLDEILNDAVDSVAAEIEAKAAREAEKAAAKEAEKAAAKEAKAKGPKEKPPKTEAMKEILEETPPAIPKVDIEIPSILERIKAEPPDVPLPLKDRLPDTPIEWDREIEEMVTREKDKILNEAVSAEKAEELAKAADFCIRSIPLPEV